jgi:hypothetical protein
VLTTQNDEMRRATTWRFEQPDHGNERRPQRRAATEYRTKPLNRLDSAMTFLAAPALALDNTYSEALPLR